MRTLWPTLLFLLTTAAQADCGYTINMGSFMAAVREDAQVLPHSLTLERTQSSENNCGTYRLYFGKGYANSYQRRAYSGIRSVTYNLHPTINTGNILKERGDAGPNEYIVGQAPSKNVPYTSSWYVSVPSLYSLFSSPAGVYTDVVPIYVYQVKSNGDVDYETTRYLTLSFTIPRFVELSLVPENANHDPSATTYVMDFGELSPGEELRADLRVMGNVGYGVSITSLNGGRLMNGMDTGVPYQIRVGSANYFTPTPAGSPHQVAQRYFGTDTDGERYNLRVKIGNFTSSALSGGDYQDVVTITVQAW